MASRSIKLPDIGEGVAEAEVVEWHIQVGEVVREDQIVAAVMTDKATVEIPSPADGAVTALGAEAGQVLAVGAELFRLEVGGDGAGSAPEPGIAASKQVKAAQSAAAGTGASDLEPAVLSGLAPASIA
jgi:2-oxoisovalerate dehydrogenase E2 component (dihydrolipoyl transacylase)